MKQILLCALLLPLLLCPPTQARTLSVVTENFPPYNYLDETGMLAGVSTAIVYSALAEANLIPDIQVLPWARAYDMAKNDPGVLIYTILRTEKREDDFHWIGPIIPAIPINFYRLSSREDIELQTLDDARRYTIGVMRDGVVHHFLKGKGFRDGVELDVAPSEVMGLKKLLAGHVDLIYANELSMNYRLRDMGCPRGKLERLIPFMEFGYYMAFGKKTDPQLVEQVRAGFERINAAQ